MTDKNDFTYWERLLAGERLPIDANEPFCGYYKTRGREGRMMPVAFWYVENTLRCRVNNVEVLADRALELWPFAAKAPVSYADYQARIQTGKWPGEHDAVIGHNRSPVEDSPDAIGDRINDLAREALKLIEAGAALDDATCDQASDLANSLGEMETKADKLRAAEKDPHVAAARAVDGKWNPLRDKAADFKRRLKAIVVTPWLTRKKADAEAAAVKAIAAGAPVETIMPPKATAGSSKRATALRTYHRADIIDRNALIDSLRDHPDLVACVQKIADAAASKKVALPGVKIVSEQRAA